MGKKGGKRHMKRLSAPRYWPIHRKEERWTVRAKPGPHPKDDGLPTLLILREILGAVRTRKEAKLILSEGQFKVDGKVRRDQGFLVGLMDVVEIPSMKRAYRVLPVPKKGLGLHPIGDEEKGFKLCKIVDKATVDGGDIQLNLHDGRNLLVRVDDPREAEEDVYSTSDVLKLDLPDSKILEHIKFEEGAVAMVARGVNAGRVGKIVSVERGAGSNPAIVTLEEDGLKIQTSLDSVFVLGKGESSISIPGVGGSG